MVNIDELLERVKHFSPKANLELIKKAADFSAKVHEGQKRLSGDDYITHPIAVAEILAELEQDSTTIAAALLHDVIEDTSVTADVLKSEFGEQITCLVLGVSKLGQLTFASKEDRQAENFRKMFVAMAEDIRIIIIKLADRLHNMQTLEFLPAQRQLDIANETREIYAPLAHRLGMWRLKWELEDLAFYYLEHDKYLQIKNLVSQKRDEREKYMSDFIKSVSEAIAKVGISAVINGRSKHFFSIYNKLVKKNVEFDDIYDLIAIRVIVDNVKDCYAVLGIVHSLWRPISGRFRDFIALPKSNGYQSLHSTVIGSAGKPVEIQIRTKEMHRIAEYGIAAHWRYKEGAAGDKNFDLKLAWLRETLEHQEEVKDAKDFLENVKIDLFVDEVFVYSPKGDVYDLPLDSTPVDFAYHVHTQVGHRCVGAKVNGKIVPFEYKLKNGDIVEILTSKIDSPRLDWLTIVKTSGARTKIKQWFKKQKKEENVERGRKTIEDELSKNDLPVLDTVPKEKLDEIARENSSASLEDLFALIGQGEVNALHIVKEVRKKLNLEPLSKETLVPKIPYAKLKRSSDGIKVDGAENVLTRLAKCCFPLPGDDIVGTITKGRGISVHRAGCTTLAMMDTEKKRIKVEWDTDTEVSYPVNIEIEAFDRVGLLKDVLTQISESKTNINSVEVKTAKGSSALINLVLDVKSVVHLKSVVDLIKRVSDVYDVYRVTAAKH